MVGDGFFLYAQETMRTIAVLALVAAIVYVIAGAMAIHRENQPSEDQSEVMAASHLAGASFAFMLLLAAFAIFMPDAIPAGSL